MTIPIVFALAGAVLGAMFDGAYGALVGGLLAGFFGFMLSPRSPRSATDAPPRYGPQPLSDADRLRDEALTERLAALERRLARLEAHAGLAPTVAGAPEIPAAPTDALASASPQPTQALVRPSGATLVDVELPHAPLPAKPVAPPAPVGAPARAEAPPAPAYAQPAPRSPNALWAWFTGGNALVRIGVVVLFFGVAFLLLWFAERFTLSIEWRLAAVALAGLALAALGLRLARERPAYGLALQGAGAGVVYLTIFAALRLYEVLPAVPAFALLVLVSATAVWLALRAQSQAMAGLAFFGGFLAPVLVVTRDAPPLPLFGYLALLNGAIAVVAWGRSWRGLTALGFLFTFALALLWGWEYYVPEHFAVVEPFLALFVALYVALAIGQAARAGVEWRRPVDALLVFGVPATAFALQHGLVRDHRYGDAWSAVALAAVYGALWLALRRRAEPALALLARAFLVIAIVFASIAIPFAVDARHTAGWWALEAGAAYWFGCRQRQLVVRVLALLLQAGAGLFLLFAGPLPGDRTWFLNAGFLGMALVAVAGFATAWLGDRHADALRPREQGFLAWVFVWAMAWWIGAGDSELAARLSHAQEGHAGLAWIAGSALAFAALARALAWPRAAWFGLVLLPAMLLVAADDFERDRTTLLAWGWLAWPLAWNAQYVTLAAQNGVRAPRVAQSPVLDLLHAASAVLLVAHLGFEAGEWTGRVTPEGTSWITAATAVPAILYLALVTALPQRVPWPFAAHRASYTATAGTVVAALLAVWYVLANAISPGDPDPLPYVPVANPLDVALAAALAVTWWWAARHTRLADRTRYAILGVALFVALNGVVVRTVHHWLGVPWRLDALLVSKPLQAALTVGWTAIALPLMFVATRRRVRTLWTFGAVLLAVVVIKLFALDLSALSGLPRVVAFLGVGVLLLVIGYVAPLPPAASAVPGEPAGGEGESDSRRAPAGDDREGSRSA